jgi:hypothetical protein
MPLEGAELLAGDLHNVKKVEEECVGVQGFEFGHCRLLVVDKPIIRTPIKIGDRHKTDSSREGEFVFSGTRLPMERSAGAEIPTCRVGAGDDDFLSSIVP